MVHAGAWLLMKIEVRGGAAEAGEVIEACGNPQYKKYAWTIQKVQAFVAESNLYSLLQVLPDLFLMVIIMQCEFLYRIKERVWGTGEGTMRFPVRSQGHRQPV